MSTGAGRWQWGTALVAALAVAVVIAVVVSLWRQLGDVAISPLGWLAMGLGALVTLALGVGLMTLVFISSRRGYDEQDGDHR